MPVSRINLVGGTSGTAYTITSPNLYGCASSLDEECLVNLADRDEVDNLLKTISSEDSGEGTVGSEMEPATYTGVGIEFCHQYNAQAMGGEENSYFEARLKGSVELNGTVYYTNATDGLSTTGPSEEVKVKVEGAGCGMFSPLVEPVTLSKDTPTNVVLYTDPMTAVASRL